MALGRGIGGTWQEEQEAPDLVVEHGRAHAWFGWSGEFGAGYDGEIAWEFAPGETPHGLDPASARAYQLQHRLDRDAHLGELFPVRSILADKTLDGRPQHVVRMTPVLGSDEMWYFDAATGLLSRIERTVDRGTTIRVLTFDDYRDVDGVRLPHRLGINTGDRPVTITITSIVNNVPMEADHFARPGTVRVTKPPST